MWFLVIPAFIAKTGKNINFTIKTNIFLFYFFFYYFLFQCFKLYIVTNIFTHAFSKIELLHLLRQKRTVLHPDPVSPCILHSVIIYVVFQYVSWHSLFAPQGVATARAVKKSTYIKEELLFLDWDVLCVESLATQTQ